MELKKTFGVTKAVKIFTPMQIITMNTQILSNDESERERASWQTIKQQRIIKRKIYKDS